MKDQHQDSGADSVNLQAGRDISVNVGISATEVLQIAEHVFRSNFLTLSTQAANEAEKRAQDLLDEFMKRAAHLQLDLSPARSPDAQYALYSAQRDYARSGQQGLKGLLVDLLVNKFRAQHGSLHDIALSEAIETARKLTTTQVSALTACWLITRVVDNSITSLTDAKAWLTAHVGPFIDDLPIHVSEYEHIQYTGCGIISMGGTGVGGALVERYPGLFQRGQLPNAINEKLWTLPDREVLFRPSVRTPNGYEVASSAEQSARELIASTGHTELAEIYVALLKRNITDTEAEDELTSGNQTLSILVEKWRSSSIGNLSLSTVGIALAHANWERVTKQTADLKIWLPSTQHVAPEPGTV
jgi:hypothetical protein